LAEVFNKSDIEILVATMHRNSLDFLALMFPMCHFSKFNIVVINQTSAENILSSEYPTVKVINSFERGLSKSRNLALENATAQLCVITDDDVTFTDGFHDNILMAFNNNPSAALIAFRAEKSEGILYKKYPQQRVEVESLSQRLNIMSIEMVLNRTMINGNNITFNKNFGLGANFLMGEEAIFINDINKKKLLMIMEPRVIVRHNSIDTHARVTPQENYYVQGALFTSILKNNYFVLILLKLAHEIKHSKIKFYEIPDAVRAAIKGRRAFKKMI
jgi:glycosyltransferase involved in cell wall biosynthesis